MIINTKFQYSHYIFAYKHLNDKVASVGGLSRVPRLGPIRPQLHGFGYQSQPSPQGNFIERLQCENVPVVPVGRVKVVPHDYS